MDFDMSSFANLPLDLGCTLIFTLVGVWCGGYLRSLPLSCVALVLAFGPLAAIYVSASSLYCTYIVIAGIGVSQGVILRKMFAGEKAQLLAFLLFIIAILPTLIYFFLAIGGVDPTSANSWWSLMALCGLQMLASGLLIYSAAI